MRYVHMGICVYMALSAPAFAEDMKAAAQDAFSRAQVFSDFSLEKADEVLAPEVHNQLPQSSMDTATLEQQGAWLATDPTTVEGKTFETLGQNQHDSTFAPAPDAFDEADAADLDPEALVASGTFSASGGKCTVTNFDQAPRFRRTCDAVRLTRTETCRQIPRVTFIYEVSAFCASATEATFCNQFKWPGTTCKPSNADLAVVGHCRGETDPRDYGYVQADTLGTLSVTHRVEWHSHCTGSVDPATCVHGQTVCTGEQISWTSSPLTVTEPCSELSTEFTCPGDNYANDCEVFEQNPSCSLISAVCFSNDPDGGCGALERTYECGGEINAAFGTECENINVCVAGVCDAVAQEPNDEIPHALAGIGLLNSISADWNKAALDESGCVTADAVALGMDPLCFSNGEINYFSSDLIGCRKAILAIFNCCRDSGWALGVFTSCKDREYVLAAALDAERTVYVRTRCSEKVLFLCVEKSRDHCVFNGRFAREVSLQGQYQIYGRFECRGLTHDEFSRLDFTQIDLSPLFADLLAEVETLDAAALEDRIRSNALLNAPQLGASQ